MNEDAKKEIRLGSYFLIFMMIFFNLYCMGGSLMGALGAFGLALLICLIMFDEAGKL